MMKLFNPADYQSGRPRINARVFADLFRFSVIGVDYRGVFGTDESAGTFDFRTLVAAMKKTDKYHLLTVADIEDAVAMLFHLLPGTFEYDERPDTAEVEGDSL